MTKLRVGVLMGGLNLEREVSFNSGLLYAITLIPRYMI